MSMVPVTTQAAFTANISERVLELRGAGGTWRQIGKELGVHHTAAMRWYKRAAGEQLKRIEALRESAFYEDLAVIQDQLDALNSDLDITADDYLPKLAALIKLIETKAKFLRYADLKFDDSTAPVSRGDLIAKLQEQAKLMGERVAAAVVVDVGE